LNRFKIGLRKEYILILRGNMLRFKRACVLGILPAVLVAALAFVAGGQEAVTVAGEAKASAERRVYTAQTLTTLPPL
jgi:hypothetical protein